MVLTLSQDWGVVMFKRKLSELQGDSGGTVRCPKCGGTQFTAKRSAFGKTAGVLTVGVGALLVPKTRVKCVTCGKEFMRG